MTFFGETVAAMDADAWRLTVSGMVAQPERLSLSTLKGLGEEEREAVLDCTSGWALRTTWRGGLHSQPLERPPRSGRAHGDRYARRRLVRQACRWARRAGQALLAAGVSGQRLPARERRALPPGGAGRRGLEWVKWVTEVEVA